MINAWLTIDDSPSEATPRLLNFLAVRNIQALLFVRGHRMDESPAYFDSIVDAIKQGHIIGNHSYAHEPAGELSFDEWVEDFERCEALINRAYEGAAVQRPGLYYRFPYLDRGDGERLERAYPDIIAKVSAEEAFNLVVADQARQDYLKQKGFEQPFAGIDHPLYTKAGMADVHDCLMTYSTQDWAMTSRHQAKQAVTLEQLKKRIDEDPFIVQGCDQIVLVHDEAEIHDVTTALIDHMCQTLDFKFQTI